MGAGQTDLQDSSLDGLRPWPQLAWRRLLDIQVPSFWIFRPGVPRELYSCLPVERSGETAPSLLAASLSHR